MTNMITVIIKYAIPQNFMEGVYLSILIFRNKRPNKYNKKNIKAGSECRDTQIK